MVHDLSIVEHWVYPVSESALPAHHPEKRDLNPKYLVLHDTGNRSLDDSVYDWTNDNGIKESMHLVVGLDGEYVQLAGFNTKVWHCGASYYQGHHGLNNSAIGVALVSAPKNENYTEVQLSLLDQLIPLLVDEYNLRDIVLHQYVSVDQSDPGYNFPQDRYWPFVRNMNAESIGRFAVTGMPPKKTLNVRGGPDVHFEVIDQLNAGAGVKVIRMDASEQWCQIVYKVQTEDDSRGWVHESFLRRL